MSHLLPICYVPTVFAYVSLEALIEHLSFVPLALVPNSSLDSLRADATPALPHLQQTAKRIGVSRRGLTCLGVINCNYTSRLSRCEWILASFELRLFLPSL